jgi:hypothetical protein
VPDPHSPEPQLVQAASDRVPVPTGERKQ